MQVKTVNIPFAEASAIWTRSSVEIFERIYEKCADFLMTHQNVNIKNAHFSNHRYRLEQPWYPKLLSEEIQNLLINKIETWMLMYSQAT